MMTSIIATWLASDPTRASSCARPSARKPDDQARRRSPRSGMSFVPGGTTSTSVSSNTRKSGDSTGTRAQSNRSTSVVSFGEIASSRTSCERECAKSDEKSPCCGSLFSYFWELPSGCPSRSTRPSSPHRAGCRSRYLVVKDHDAQGLLGRTNGYAIRVWRRTALRRRLPTSRSSFTCSTSNARSAVGLALARIAALIKQSLFGGAARTAVRKCRAGRSTAHSVDVPIRIEEARNTPLDDPRRTEYFGLIRNTGPFNEYGIPSISVPCGFSREGLPIGLQISGRALGELDVLALAHAYEQATDWHERVPQLA